MKDLKEELGDLLFHIVFIAQICRERDAFDINDVIENVYSKMYHRHPHVFQKEVLDVPIEMKWGGPEEGREEGYRVLAPREHPPSGAFALLRAYVMTKRAAKVGFDWQKIEDVYDKMYEEIAELKAAEAAGDQELVREEVGDLIFTIVNIARFLSVDPEDALRATSDKFTRRFTYIEDNTDIRNSDADTMDKLWNDSKSLEDKGK